MIKIFFSFILGLSSLHSAYGMLAHKTQVHTPTGNIVVEKLTAGSRVLTADGVRNLLSSSSTSEQALNHVVMIIQQQGLGLLVSLDQPFLLSDNTIVRARNLTSHDRLVDETGKPVRILRLSKGVFGGGMQNISVPHSPLEKLDEHLLIANGVFIGDSAVKMFCREICQRVGGPDFWD